MDLTIEKILTSKYTKNNKGTDRIKYIVIHYFGSLGTAKAVANYFKTSKVESSAHYCLDEGKVVYQCVEDKDTAWHCGASKYKHTECRNNNSIGIEVRPHKLNKKSVKSGDKDWYFRDDVLDNLVEFTKYLMDKYNVPIENVVRHYDVTGKACPRPFTGDDINEYYNESGNKKWKEFKARLVEDSEIKVDTKPTSEKKETTFKSGDKVKFKQGAKQYNGNNIRTDYMNKEYIIKEIKNDRVVLTINNIVIYAVNVKDIEPVNKEKPAFKSYKVRVLTENLEYRKGPGASYKVNGQIKDKGIYTIVGEDNNWGKLKSGVGWIDLQYTKKL